MGLPHSAQGGLPLAIARRCLSLIVVLRLCLRSAIVTTL